MLDFIFNNRLAIVSVFCSLLLLWFIIHNVKKQRIKEAYSLIWVVMGVAFLIISLWPNLMWSLAYMIGIYYGPGMIFLILIILILLILIQYSIVISKHTDRIKILTQEIALLKTECEEKNNER